MRALRLWVLTSSHLKQRIVSVGFPRTIGQAESLDTKQKFDVVINLDVPFSEIKRRIEVYSLIFLLKY